MQKYHLFLVFATGHGARKTTTSLYRLLLIEFWVKDYVYDTKKSKGVKI